MNNSGYNLLGKKIIISINAAISFFDCVKAKIMLNNMLNKVCK